MKKLLILILIGLLLALGIFVALEGVNIGTLEILGIQGIQDRNYELEEQIEQSTKLASTDFKKAISTVEEDSKKLSEEKQRYEEMTTVASESEIQEAAQLPTYEIEYLWTKLGNHATSEGAVIKMDVTKGTNTTQNTYNLKFTVTGSYISITDFISDIENDSSLGFKIEEFNMVPGGQDLQATFVCKDITIKDLSQNVVTQTDTEETEIKENDTNITNTTNSTNTTNTTNSTNTTNTTNKTNTNSKNTTNTTNVTNTTNTNR